jgi:mRNA interferase MazF
VRVELSTLAWIATAVKRGEIWTAAGGKDYAGKPRPVVIIQRDRFDMTDSITVCATTDPTDAPLFRWPVELNGIDSELPPSTSHLNITTKVRSTIAFTPVLRWQGNSPNVLRFI